MDQSPTLDRAVKWAAYFAATWAPDSPSERPERIHSSAVAQDGSPEWYLGFGAWLTREEGRASERRPEDSLRTMRVMRRLRRVAIREYEVLYRMLVLRESLAGTTAWLNQRAISNQIPLPDGRPEHYRPKDTVALFVCGIEYALAHW